jgi:chemotaxis protein methyltransferase CheR
VDDAVLSTEDYAFLAELLLKRSALVLEPGKEYLVRARLLPVASRHGLQSISQLIGLLRKIQQTVLWPEIVEAMVTTETSFFRDVHPFETLRKTVLPELIRARRERRELNIWCAAAASGQEPYSIAILLKEHFPELMTWKLNFLGTDISKAMLQRSIEGRYSQLEVNRGLPAHLLLKYFHQEGSWWRLDQQVRNLVTFSQLNIAAAWPPMPRWDLVFLRNVMIYFDKSVKQNILGQLRRTLQPDGYLVLGAAETTLNLDDSYRRVEQLPFGFYQLKN